MATVALPRCKLPCAIEERPCGRACRQRRTLKKVVGGKGGASGGRLVMAREGEEGLEPALVQVIQYQKASSRVRGKG